MAGDWIKMRVDLFDDPAVIVVAEATGLDQDTVVGKLHRLWSWADKHMESGNAPGVTLAWLDRYLSVTGFSEALIKAGWLSHDGAALVIPKFDRHNGRSGKKRALSAKRTAKHKERKGNAPGNAEVTLRALPREEKRREEYIKPPLPPLDEILEPIRDSIASWLEYKRWRYKPRGFAALLARFRKRVEQCGADVVTEAVERAIASSYQGWDFDEWFRHRSKPKGPRLPTPEEKANWSPL